MWRGGRTAREGRRGMSKEEVMFATEISGEIRTAEAPTLIFYRVLHILGHMYAPPPTHDRAEYCIILPSEFIELTELFSKEKKKRLLFSLICSPTIDLLSFNIC